MAFCFLAIYMWAAMAKIGRTGWSVIVRNMQEFCGVIFYNISIGWFLSSMICLLFIFLQILKNGVNISFRYNLWETNIKSVSPICFTYFSAAFYIRHFLCVAKTERPHVFGIFTCIYINIWHKIATHFQNCGASWWNWVAFCYATQLCRTLFLSNLFLRHLLAT